MVMARENATNHVDEEVYDDDGNERHEAREVDEQSPMRIRPHSLLFLVKRNLQEYYVLLSHRQML